MLAKSKQQWKKLLIKKIPSIAKFAPPPQKIAKLKLIIYFNKKFKLDIIGKDW